MPLALHVITAPRAAGDEIWGQDAFFTVYARFSTTIDI